MQKNNLTLLAVILLALVAGACAPNSADPVATPTVSNISAVPLVTPTAAPSATTPPTIHPPTTTASPEAILTTQWEYVALGDSNPGGFGVTGKSYVPMYGAGMADDLDIKVKTLNLGQNGATSRSLLQRIKTNKVTREDLSTAEVVTIDIGANDWDNVIQHYNEGKCGGEDNQDCLRRVVKSFGTNLNGILDELRLLRAENPIHLLRVIDLYTSYGELFEGLASEETFAVVEPYIDEFNAKLEAATLAHDGQVVHVHARLNGPEGEINPTSFLQRDQDHLNSEGHALVAEMLRELGYEE